MDILIDNIKNSNVSRTVFGKQLYNDLWYVDNNNLPKNYKLFYDDEIKKMVDIYYKDDIEKYGFTFDNFL